MTTSPAIRALGSEGPWLRDDHWKAGDKAWWLFPTGSGVSRTMVDIVDPAEGTVRDPRVIYNDGVFRATGKFERIRHREDSCTACADSVRRELAYRMRDLADHGLLRVDDPDRAALHFMLLISASRPFYHPVSLTEEEIAESVTAGVRTFLYGHVP